MTGHRVSLANGLYNGCLQEAGKIKFHFSHQLLEVTSFGPKPRFTVKPRDAQALEVSCDVLLGADGVKSTIRTAILQHLKMSAKIIDTGQAAYRIMLHRRDMENDPELKSLIDMDGVTRWIGERKHIIA
jgi:salicylate hydroxylase